MNFFFLTFSSSHFPILLLEYFLTPKFRNKVNFLFSFFLPFISIPSCLSLIFSILFLPPFSPSLRNITQILKDKYVLQYLLLQLSYHSYEKEPQYMILKSSRTFQLFGIRYWLKCIYKKWLHRYCWLICTYMR